MRTNDIKKAAEDHLEEYDEVMIDNLLEMIKDELGSKSLLYLISADEFAGNNIEDIDSEMFTRIMDEAKATEEDREIFMGCLESFDVQDADEWAMGEAWSDLESYEDAKYEAMKDARFEGEVL